jgi:hypothetical protein
MTKVRFPFDNASAASLTATGAQAISIVDDMTIIDGVTVEATGNRTINLTIDDEVIVGARILLRLKTNGTETTAFGTGMQGATLTGAAGKTKNVEFVYNGTNFVEAGTPVQID